MGVVELGIAIVTLLGTILGFIFNRVSKRDAEVNREQQALATVEVDELDAGLDRLDKLQSPKTST